MSSTQDNVLKASYWPHIDGLRAIAVLAVLLFHFKALGFEAGYLGVDIFFVISGFLVTRLILKDIGEHGKMRFGRFFARRVRRLFPTLAAVCVATAIAAYILLDAEKLAAFGKSVTAAIFSLSNILFWSESGYFDAGSESKPLLHTWSLSVEEQFYLFWPATLALGYKIFKTQALKIVSIAAFVVSIALIVLWTLGRFDARTDSTIFYWMPFRVFEFMLGAFCILLFPKFTNLKPGSSFGVSIIGIILMLAAIIVPSFNSYSNGPILGAIACIGAALVILSPNNGISNTLLSAPPVRWIGKISYSLYLVHWPLWIFAPEWLKTGGLNWIPLIAISILLTIPLHYIIETPLRHGKLSQIMRTKPAGDLFAYGAIAAIIAAFGMYISSQSNLPFRKTAEFTAAQYEAGMKNRFSNLRCLASQLEKDPTCDWEKPVQILFFGNSHEADGFNAFYHVLSDNPAVNFINFETTNGCDHKIINGKIASDVSARNCIKRVDNLNRLLAEKTITHVVFTANIPFAPNKQTMWSSLKVMQDANPETKFVVMGGFLNTKENCTTIINRHGGFDACLRPEYTKFFPNEEIKNKFVETEIDYLYIDRAKLMCSDGTAQSCVPSHKNTPIFFDPHHMSLEYAELVGERMMETYKTELARIGILGD